MKRLAVVVLFVATGCGAAPSAATPSGAPAMTAGATPSEAPVVTPGATPSEVPFPLEATLPELQDAMVRGDLTSVELVDFYLARIAAYDDAGPELNAFIVVNPAARDEAAALDAERAASGPRGPLHGIPVVLKDNIGTADMATTAGSLALEGFRPPEDAYQVRRLREAGAVIIGKANMFEFARSWETASPLGGQTLNPYDLSRDPGGSSGGTAVAVTANFAAVGLGTDTCGSIRLPSAHNNLFGLRPTSGLSSRAGVIPFSSTLDAVGPMARSVVDLAIVLDATVGEDPADPTTVPVAASYVDAVDPAGLAGRRIGLVRLDTAPDVGLTLTAALDEMETNGAEFIDVTMPETGPDDIVPLLGEIHSALETYLAAQPGGGAYYPAVLQALGDEPTSLDTDMYRDALEGREAFRAAVVALMDEHDLDAIAYPGAERPAALIGDQQEASDCWSSAYGGLPAIAIPAGLTPDGLPVGIELIGRPFDEPTLIAIGAGYEAHTDRRVLPPTTPPLDSAHIDGGSDTVLLVTHRKLVVGEQRFLGP